MLGLSPMAGCGTELAFDKRNCPMASIMGRGYRTMLKSFVFRDVRPCIITDLYSTSVLRVDDSPDLIIRAVGYFETSVSVYQSTRDIILEDLNIWQQIYQKTSCFVDYLACSTCAYVEFTWYWPTEQLQSV
jgi:hypothetical protein